ncbi:nodulation protein NopA [Mesorhizobium amorphae]|uniref:nodulation protein NopA n=1 Tax=Mesorhizobium amorphae TaxID=71433 RepID=UPI00235CB541|nr:nodulation protein NopA [Mesorhizobium amorphae]GLR46018.1 nodulation protein NopA [Mesorhizobium amorphae]
MVDKVGGAGGTAGHAAATGAGTAGHAVNTVKDAATDFASTAAGDAAFQAQIAKLTAVSLEATQRSVTMRTVTTQLGSIKKVADERVQ